VSIDNQPETAARAPGRSAEPSLGRVIGSDEPDADGNPAMRPAALFHPRQRPETVTEARLRSLAGKLSSEEGIALPLAMLMMGVFAVIPFAEPSGRGVLGLGGSIGDVNAGILFVFALTSIGVYGISLAGWSSGSKFPLLGSVRATAQMISYELSMSMSVIGVLILAGSTSLAEIVHAQRSLWFVIPQIVGFVIYLMAAVAETNRAPFDLPEAEQELIGGFLTEYSGLKFVMYYLAEYVNMITVSALAALLFFGGWYLWFVPPVIAFFIKIVLFLFLYIWLRGTFPRLRYDMLMRLGWKVLLPLAIANVIVTGIILVATQG